MRTFLSKFLLLMFIVVFSIPNSLLAQEYSWIAPTGGPTIGTNTPPPVNIGPSSQSKVGPLKIDGTLTAGTNLNVDLGSTLRGPTFFDSTRQDGDNFVVSFVPAIFLSSVDIGQTGIGRDLNLFGKFRYRSVDQNGFNVGPQPVAGSILKSADTDGSVVWGSGIPDGAADGDTLIWDDICNCWTTGTGGGGGGTGNLPPGTAGQTMWYNGATNAWEATDQIKHDTYTDGGGVTQSRTKLSNNFTNIESPNINLVGSSRIRIGSPGSVGETDLQSRYVVFGLPSQQSQQDVSFNSNNINFNDPALMGGSQAVTFNSSSIKFKGPSSNPGALDAGVGRIPYSTDADGTFKWNKNLKYIESQPFPGITLGQLTLSNPLIGISAFVNEGATFLQGNTYISENGDLFLEGLNAGGFTEWDAGQIKNLCYLEGSFKVVSCPPTPLPIDNVPGGILTPIGVPGEGVVLFTENGEEFTFNFEGTVDVKYCGGGGGGGGGGIGQPSGNNPTNGDAPGTGGAGGGGGAAGQCVTREIDVSPGDVLSWNIGEGGLEGRGAGSVFMTTQAPLRIASEAGGFGQSTSITFDPLSGPSETFELASGGIGGRKGQSVYEMVIQDQVQPNFGINGNSNLGFGWDGTTGGTSNFPLNCPSCGGDGGWGEAYDLQDQILTNLTGATSSARGNGGVGSNIGSTNFGQRGRCGVNRNGGGGGGGSFGIIIDSLIGQELGFSQNVIYEIYGGYGGCGGDGYVMISGLPEDINTPEAPREIIFVAPGSNTLTQDQITMINNWFEDNGTPFSPDQVKIEMWGAGGGSQPLPSNTTSVIRTAGGGSGEYTVRNLNIYQLSSDPNLLRFNVGAKGVNGSRGGSTNFLINNSSSVASEAGGGWGGVEGDLNDNVRPPGSARKGGGWVPNTFYDGTSGSITGSYQAVNYVNYNRGSEGLPGALAGTPCNLANEPTPATLGFGRGEPRKCMDSTLNQVQGSAQNGRIRISW